MEQSPPKRYLRPKDVCAKLNISKANMYDKVSKGLLPKPLKFGRSSLFIESEIEAAVEQVV